MEHQFKEFATVEQILVHWRRVRCVKLDTNATEYVANTGTTIK